MGATPRRRLTGASAAEGPKVVVSEHTKKLREEQAKDNAVFSLKEQLAKPVRTRTEKEFANDLPKKWE